MPRIVVRKSYRCQPGKRRDLLAALQKIDAAAAEAGYPRGRYLFVETRAPGEPDLEVEFVFESYAEMERLERAMRERVVRYLREGGAAGQELLLEPSATKHLLLIEATVARTPASQTPAAQTQTRAAAAKQAAPQAPPDLTFDEDEDDEEFEAPPEPEVPPPPEIPPGMTPDQARRAQLDRARAALQGAERAVGQTPRRPPRAQ